ncbi:phage holin family protein [Candidatus Gottesmanbacteria bacterium]|nr:phage holin family protein [Candidatus Gottesmanbacteria bacterium]
MRLIADWLVKAFILLLTTYFVPGFQISSFTSALVVILVLALLSVFVKPILLFLTLPINLLTLGLFTFVINAFLLYVAAQFVPGFHIDGFTTAIVAAVIMAIISGLISLVFEV